MHKVSERIVWVDELRGYACLLIVLLHVTAIGTKQYDVIPTQSWQIYNIINAFTRMAVPIFFALSGYIFFYGRAPKGKHFLKIAMNIIFYSIISFMFLHFILFKFILFLLF